MSGLWRKIKTGPRKFREKMMPENETEFYLYVGLAYMAGAITVILSRLIIAAVATIAL